MSIKSELLDLQNSAKDGILHVETVHRWAKAHPRSSLHKAIEWDVHKAAREYQFWQIRRLVAIHIVDESGSPEIVNLKVDRYKGGGYRLVDDVLSSKALSALMLKDALEELERTEVKYRRVKELTSVWTAVGRVRKRSRPRDSKDTRPRA